MKAYGTYFQNDPERPLVYGEVELINPPRQRLRGEEKKEGILVQPAMVGFCGTDHELMRMGARGELSPKFPAGQKRLINGHEGVVWVPSQNRFAIVLIRGGDSVDPTRYTEDETYFEYGCDQADGLFCDAMYGEYYRIKAGIVLVGGFSIDEDFNLYFTPLFHGKACGKSHKIDSIGQLVEIIREQFERREVKMKG